MPSRTPAPVPASGDLPPLPRRRIRRQHEHDARRAPPPPPPADPPMPSALSREALLSDAEPAGNPECSFSLFSVFKEESQRIVEHELRDEAVELLLQHFKEVTTEELARVQCPQYGSIANQEMAIDETPEPSEKDPNKMKNNTTSLALIREDGDHVLLIRLTDSTFRQARNLIPNDHDWCVNSCYRVPIESIKEVSKSEIPVNLSYVDGDCNYPQSSAFDSSNALQLECGPCPLKQKHPIDQISLNIGGACSTSPLKKRRGRKVSSKKKRPSILNTGTRIDAANLKCDQDLNVESTSCCLKQKCPSQQAPSTNDGSLSTTSLKQKRHRSTLHSNDEGKHLIPCTSDGSARTSINGWDWLKWSQNATQAQKVHLRGWKIVERSLPLNNDRANRAIRRRRLARIRSSKLASCMQLKGRTKQLRCDRSMIHGWGVRAVEPIKSEELIVEYVGEVIRRQVSDIREVKYKKAGVLDYFFKIDDDHVVDATFRGGIARYINHSCEPNCYTKVITSNGQKKIFIYAKKDIKAGEELTYNYLFPLEKDKIPCLCGSRRCRRWMN